MRIVLAAVNAKYIHSNLAVYSLRAYAREYRGQIAIAEYTINHRTEDILADLYRRKPDVLAFSCYLWNVRCVREVAEELHKLLPDTALWAGGPEVSYEARQFLEENPCFTGVMRGEGEETFRELAGYYRAREAQSPGEKSLEDIRGLTWRQGEEIRETPGREPVDLDVLPFPYEDLGEWGNRILYYESSRGCPFSCSYCLSSVERRLRFRSLALVKRELDIFLEAKVSQVKFVDRTFNCSRERAAEIWEYLESHDNGVTNFHFEIAADLLTEKDLEIFARMRPGLIQLEIGVQSANPETLRAVCRRTDLGRLRERVLQVKALGRVHQHLDLIAGLPYEDYESFARSFQEVYEMEPDQLQLGFLKVLKGSPMYRQAQGYGIAWRGCPPYEVLYTRWLSYGELLRFKQAEEMTEVYYNSGQFLHTIRHLAREYGNPFWLYQELGIYYEEHGLFGVSHSQQGRCEILLHFLEEKFPDKALLYRELLLLDLWQRENRKSRPVWGMDQSPWKEKIREFFRQEEKERRYLTGYEGFDARQLGRMAHVEIFRFPVTDEERMGELLGRAAGPAREWAGGPAGEYAQGICGEKPSGGWAVLFDYRNRDPIHHGAAVWELGFWETGDRT